jgi:hypothetical protein
MGKAPARVFLAAGRGLFLAPNNNGDTYMPIAFIFHSGMLAKTGEDVKKKITGLKTVV